MKSSWQEYVDITLLGSGYVSKAVIFGLEKTQRWAASQGFNVSPEEAKSFIKGFVDPEHLVAAGIDLNEKQYTLVRSDSTLMIGKCSGGGCILAKTEQVLVIAVYEDNMHGSSCLSLVTKLTDYLRHHNF